MDSQIIKQSNPQKLSFHPFLTIFPEMGKVAFDEFVADIRDHGIREAIWTHKNQIIDGRNRWLACEQLVLPCPTREYVGDEKDLLAFVISQNLHRRQLDASQRAMVAARIATMRQGARTDLQPRPNLAEVSIQDAGKLLNVSTGNVKSAKRVIAKAEPEIVKAVEQGKLAVSAATKVALQPADVQRHAVAKIDEGAKGADVVRALPPSGGKAKRPSVINIAAKKPPTGGNEEAGARALAVHARVRGVDVGRGERNLAAAQHRRAVGCRPCGEGAGAVAQLVRGSAPLTFQGAVMRRRIASVVKITEDVA